MTYSEILSQISLPQMGGDAIYEAINFVEDRLLDFGREDFEALDITIRLLDASKRGLWDEDTVEAMSLLVRDCGLFPYADSDGFKISNKALLAAHSVDLNGRVTLHSKQMEVLLRLLQRDNVILSAPTSFGKSLIVDAYIRLTHPNTVVMVVPTIALIDETRRRTLRNLERRYQIISQRGQKRANGTPTIYVLTQERLLDRDDIEEIDLLFVDEFYKLDPNRDDDRADALNVALYKNIPKSAQIFMAGPHIKSITLGPKWNGQFRFVQTDYRTVSVNIIDRSGSESHLAYFLQDLKSVGTQASLIFTAHPGSAMELAQNILDEHIEYTSERSEKLGEWIGQNYHQDWILAAATRRGIATHHGRIPRSLGQLFVHEFDNGTIKALICTSTLIEGVNTSAANVFLYDKKINREDFDFFSFANIRGRVGRMMRHFVGNAFLYHQAPEEVDTQVDVPVLSDPSNSSDYILLNVDDKDLAPQAIERAENLVAQSGLPRWLLARYGSLGVERLLMTNEKVKEAAEGNPELIVWAGFPSKEQRIFFSDIILRVFAYPRHIQLGARTAKEMAWCLYQISVSRSIPSFIRWFVRMFKREDSNDIAIDRAFQFITGCDYMIPTVIGAIEGLAKFHLPEESINYGAYIVKVENLFRYPWMKAVDEIGIPLPLAERLESLVPNDSTVDQAVEILRGLLPFEATEELSEMDAQILNSALRG